MNTRASIASMTATRIDQRGDQVGAPSGRFLRHVPDPRNDVLVSRADQGSVGPREVARHRLMLVYVWPPMTTHPDVYATRGCSRALHRCSARSP